MSSRAAAISSSHRSPPALTSTINERLPPAMGGLNPCASLSGDSFRCRRRAPCAPHSQLTLPRFRTILSEWSNSPIHRKPSHDRRPEPPGTASHPRCIFKSLAVERLLLYKESSSTPFKTIALRLHRFSDKDLKSLIGFPYFFSMPP